MGPSATARLRSGAPSHLRCRGLHRRRRVAQHHPQRDHRRGHAGQRRRATLDPLLGNLVRLVAGRCARRTRVRPGHPDGRARRGNVVAAKLGRNVAIRDQRRRRDARCVRAGLRSAGRAAPLRVRGLFAGDCLGGAPGTTGRRARRARRLGGDDLAYRSRRGAVWRRRGASEPDSPPGVHGGDGRDGPAPGRGDHGAQDERAAARCRVRGRRGPGARA